MNLKFYFFGVVLFNLCIAVGFYIDNTKLSILDTSSDLANIIPICQKLDHTHLFPKDLCFNDVQNINYYTPTYVNLLRFFAKFTHGDYLKALNILSFFTHILFGLIWFLFFFSLKRDFWIAFFMSIFVRGIIWPPGAELLGISELWTMMPRTVFLAFLPLPFILYVYLKKQWLAAIVLGLLVNLHPISGIGAILLYMSFFSLHHFFVRHLPFKKLFGNLIVSSFFILIGMLPYLFTYLTHVKSTVSFDQALFDQAFFARLGDKFSNPSVFFKAWHRPVTYFYLAILFLFLFFDDSKRKVHAKMLFSSLLILLFFSNVIVPFEQLINFIFDKHLKFSFQLIRIQKFSYVIAQVALFYLLVILTQKLNLKNRTKFLGVGIYLVLLSFSSHPTFSKTPFLGDDISQYILPQTFKLYKKPNIDYTQTLEMFDFVKKNTNETDLFYCKNLWFRAATKRSEVLDYHAAGLLIESNPQRFIDTYLKKSKFDHLKSQREKVEFLKTLNVDYYILNEDIDLKTHEVFSNGKHYVYKIK